MKKLIVLLGLLFAFSFVGCFDDGDDCVGDACLDDEAALNLGDPIVEEEELVKETEDPVVEDKPLASVEPFAVTQVDPQEVEFVNTDIDEITEILEEQLTPGEFAKITVLRDSIEHGLELGKLRYLETVSLALADFGVAPDYEGTIIDGSLDMDAVPEECPFAKYYDNGFEPTGLACEYLVDLAKVEVYSELSKDLDSNPLPSEIMNSEHFLEANFWYEQGAISGVEEQRTVVRSDLKARELCSQKPTPVQSSYDKGVLVGRQLFAAKLNKWLGSKGYVPDYPAMSSPIQVCNADQSMLLPSKQQATNTISAAILADPLCADYEPPTQEGVLQYSQAVIDYEKGVKQGIESEFALAAVKVFKVIPCNVSDPIVVDLDGDGIELLNIARGVDFDLYGVGGKQAVAWVSPDDGLLVLDRNSNGVVDNGSELFGNLQEAYGDGFEHLAELDRPEFGGNQDGMLSAEDAAFKYLFVWRDADSNGISTRNEMLPLAGLQVHNISLAASASDLTSAGNRVAKISHMGTAGGRLMVGDAYFVSAPYPRLSR